MEEELILNIKIDGTQSAQTIKQLTERNKELAKALRDAPREGTEEFKRLRGEIEKGRQEFARNREEIRKFNRSLRETDVAADSLKGLSRQLRTLEDQYKKLGKTAREDAFGRDLQRRILATRNQLKKLEGELGDNRRNVGNYGKAWQRAGARIAGVGRAAGAALAVEFAIQGLEALDETITKFTELRTQIETFSGESGEALDEFTVNIEGIANTFEQESGDIASAANTLSKNLGVSFDEAIGLIEEGFLAGADANGDFISSLEELSEEAGEAGVSAEELVLAIQQSAKNGTTANAELVQSYKGINVELTDVIDTSSDLQQQQQAQLEANKQLAEAQNELTKNLSGSAASLRLLGTNIQTVAITAFNELIEVLSPVGEAFGGLFEALGRLFSAFQSTGEQGSVLSGIISALSFPIRITAQAVTFLVNIFSSLVDGIATFVEETPVLQSAVNAASTAFGVLRDTIAAIPAFFSAIVAAASQAGTNIANFFRGIAIDAQILFQQLQQINPFGPTQAQIDATIADLRSQREELARESVGIFEAFGTAFEEALAQQNELAENVPEATAEAADEIEKTLEDAFTKGTRAGVRNAVEETKELEKQAQEGSLKALRDAITTIKEEFDLLTAGTEEFNLKLAELIKAEQELAKVEAEIKAARESPEEQQARIQKELEAIRQKNAEELQAARELVNQVTNESLANKIFQLSEEKKLALQSETLTAQERLEIERNFQTQVLQARIQAERERLTIVETGSEEELQIRQSLIDLELQLLEQQLDEEERISQERIERKEEEAGRIADLEKAIVSASIAATKQLVDTRFNLSIQKAEEEKNRELEILREEIAEKLQQAQGNAAAEEALLEEQARREREIEKKAAEQKKALSIAQAVIGGALGAVQTIANLGFPAAIPALIAVAASVAANIATITSQKLAKGDIAKIRKKKRFDTGGIAPGKPHSQGGTPAIITDGAGNGEFVEIEVNEAIVNRRSTSRFLQTLSDINQAEGGIRYAGTKALTSNRLRELQAFEMLSSNMPTLAKRGLSPRFSPSVRRRFQTGGLSSVQAIQAQVGREVEFRGRVLTEEDVSLIAKASAQGVKQGVEEANLFGQFRRQAEREINQENRSQV